jgi:hypothetical protein
MRAQALIRRVIQMAHARGIQVALGFEFGVYPPELFSIVPQDSYLHVTLLPDPTHPASVEILHNTIDDMLHAYPGLDWICVWLQEIESPGDNKGLSTAFQQLLARDAAMFSPAAAFSGVRALAFIREARQYIARQAPRTRVAIGGWGNRSPVARDPAGARPEPAARHRLHVSEPRTGRQTAAGGSGRYRAAARGLGDPVAGRRR